MPQVVMIFEETTKFDRLGEGESNKNSNLPTGNANLKQIARLISGSNQWK